MYSLLSANTCTASSFVVQFSLCAGGFVRVPCPLLSDSRLQTDNRTLSRNFPKPFLYCGRLSVSPLLLQSNVQMGGSVKSALTGGSPPVQTVLSVRLNQ